MRTTTKKYHTAIIGTGAAGLTAAIHLARQAPDQNILIGTKSTLDISSSAHAQGGIAVPWDVPFDNVENHIHDTMEAGGYKNDLDVVRTIIQDARTRISELAEWGMPFDREASGKLRLHREGGHSHHRIAHHGDQTGKALIDTLIEKLINLPNVTAMDQLFVTDLLLDEEKNCIGFEAISKGQIIEVLAKNTILATGGIGQLYATTTNPKVATGDGIAMAYRAGAEVRNMAFIQFHPTAWFDKLKSPNELVTEAIRGEGAILRNHQGEAFMISRHAQADLAPRDVVARNIFLEMQATGQPHVWLDVSSISTQKLRQQYPKLWSNLKQYGLDPATDWIPVAPAAHYLCGGIHTDLNGQTSIPHLYALGESAHTGFHGANRLASNSLLEGVVMAHRCVAHLVNSGLIAESFPTATGRTLPKGQTGNANRGNNSGLTAESCPTAEVQHLMQQHANVVRDEASLKEALIKLEQLELKGFRPTTPAQFEYQNLLTIARLVLENSIVQNENAGVFYKEKKKASV